MWGGSSRFFARASLFPSTNKNICLSYIFSTNHVYFHVNHLIIVPIKTSTHITWRSFIQSKGSILACSVILFFTTEESPNEVIPFPSCENIQKCKFKAIKLNLKEVWSKDMPWQSYKIKETLHRWSPNLFPNSNLVPNLHKGASQTPSFHYSCTINPQPNMKIEVYYILIDR